MSPLKIDGAAILAKQLELVKQLYTGPAYVEKLKRRYELDARMGLAERHTRGEDEAVFFVCDCGAIGWRALVFVGNEVKVGKFWPSRERALVDGIIL